MDIHIETSGRLRIRITVIKKFQTATEISYIAPALTPTSGNPTFRIYSIDLVTFGVLDYTVYYANMSLPNYQINGPTWGKYYSVKEKFGPLLDPPYTSPSAELVPAFWHNLTEVFETKDSVFQDYFARKQRDIILCSTLRVARRMQYVD